MRFAKRYPRRLTLTVLIALALVAELGPLAFRVHANKLPNRSVELSSSTISQSANYKFSFDITTPGPLGSIRFQFCSNNSLIGEPCVRTDQDKTNIQLINQTGETGFTIFPTAAKNVIILTRDPSTANAGPVSYEFSGIVNPPDNGSYYVRVQTYDTSLPGGSDIDAGGIAYSINQGVSVNATVPPYLLFCDGLVISGYDCSTASGSYINFGELSTNFAKTGTTQIVVATNARYGYSLTVNGTTMQSGVHTINPMTGLDVSRPGTSQFGLNLVSNADPNVGQDPAGPGAGAPTANYSVSNRYMFNSGDVIASSPTSDAYRKYTVSYIVNVPSSQSPGIYVSTLTYIALATF